ncbi:MAG: fibronectin type III domain-containing protein, partial [Weeksellaceae bacterium]|nr:fibronectin type III domain-containing protein [Weeksellaceae bacterium]
MIRFLPLITLFLITQFLIAQGTENFNTSNLTDNYSNGSFSGETAGTTIVYSHCRNQGDYPISGNGIMLRRNDADPSSSSVEFHIANGVGDFTFQYRKAFTGQNNRILSVSVNNEEVFLSPIFGNSSGEDQTIYTQTIPIFKQGNVVIKIAYPSTIVNGNRQVTIDNVSWTGVLPNPEALNSPYIGVDNFISKWNYAENFDLFEIHVSDYKNRFLTQTESFENGLDTSGYEEMWEAELIGGRWILDNVIRTTQHISGNYGAQLQADYGKLNSPLFYKPKSISFYAKKGANDTSLKLSMKVNQVVTDLVTFSVTNNDFQLFKYNFTTIPEEASFILSNGDKVLYLDDLTIESEGFMKEPILSSPFITNSAEFNLPINNLEPDTKYFYKIRAKNGGVFSGFSNEIELTTKDGVVWTGNEWIYGQPSFNKVAILRGNGTLLNSFEAKSLQVENDIEIKSETTIHLQNEFKNYFNHSVIFNEGAYLLQENDLAVNSGNATFKRNATFFGYDSKFWSSPVADQKILKQNNDNGFYPNPSAVYNYNEEGRNWLRTTDTNFQPAKGYIIQVGTNIPFNQNGNLETPFVGYFNGVPHNGVFTIPATKTTNGLGDNGVGNPYGSPISMQSFMTSNSVVKALYFWNEDAHYIPGSNPASYEGQKWFSFNLTGSNLDTQEHIAPGVGFIARVTESSVLTINNSMRSDINFDDIQSRNQNEKDRFWLSLNANNNKENQILIGYIEGATNGIDEKYDAKNISNSNSFILSHSNANGMIIEGRQYPLDVNDQIPLYFRAKDTGEYTIKLENKQGIFKTQPIYLIDNELNLSINLSEEIEYVFDSELGNYLDRFEIRYQPKENLSTINLDETSDLIVYKDDSQNKVISFDKITSYKIYNYSGQL